MKYRFFSLDQVLHSPLFDFSKPYQPPKRMDRSTRPTRLGDMDFAKTSEPYYLEDDVKPLLADLFHLLFAQELRLTRTDERDVYVRLVQSAFVDDLLKRDDFLQLRNLCKGNAFAAMEAARAYQQAVESDMLDCAEEAEPLASVLTRLERRHDATDAKLHDLVQQAQTDPAQTPAVLQAASEVASNAEQIRVVTGMIQAKMQKRSAEIAQVIFNAVRCSLDAAVLAKCVAQCWGDERQSAPQQAEHNQALLDRVRNNPMLQGITRQLGRMKEMLSDLRKNDYSYGRGEKYTVTRGRDMKNLLSGELALMASPATMPLFLRKYHAKGLLQYAKRERVHKGYGDVIVCLDESGSTEGENAEWGKALALAVQDICAHEGRKFALVHFSGKGQFRTDLFLPGQYSSQDLLSAAEHFFDGGTDFETPIREALRLITEEAFENADILFITDGEDSISNELASELQEAIQGARCAVVGLLLDADSPGMEFVLEKFCERVYRVSEMYDKDDILTHL
ncbi:vWA domain-containing protein [Agathobaculum sp. LCP25S3_E8]|uniref:vWA domain-containing protein n=1 Tax=Agathobaculum sp. LCP25S3_E8 TaxID=3438735 RepID=UPI003F92AB77